jgi:hypothetical protein
MLETVKALFNPANITFIKAAKESYEAYAEQLQPHPKVELAKKDALAVLYKEFDDEVEAVEAIYPIVSPFLPSTASKKEVVDSALLLTLWVSTFPPLFAPESA